MAGQAKLLRFGLTTLLMTWLWTASSSAYEDQLSLDAASGFSATARARSLGQIGPEVSLGATVGVSQAFILRGQAGYAALFDGGRVQHTGRVRAEGAYLLDVLKVVPMVGLGTSLWIYDVDHRIHARPAIHALLGFDYLWSRSLTVGMDLRAGLLIEPSAHLAGAFECQLRLSRMFDRF